MRTTAVGLIVLSGTLWTSAAAAFSSMTVEAITSPAWVQRDGTRTAISAGDKIRTRDRISTGDSGRLALQLDPGMRLQLDFNSEIEIVTSANAETASAEPASMVRFNSGRGCVQFQAQPETSGPFNLQIGETVAIVIQERGHICVEYPADLSRLVLVEGTVQITNLVEPGMVVLGETGSEYRFDDAGYFELGKTETGMSIEIREDAPAAETANVEVEAPGSRTEAADSSDPGEVPEAGAGTLEPAGSGTAPAYVYTVYLFSTRSQDVANEANRKLQDAGHETRIITSGDDASPRYRLAVTGFSSRQAAQAYAADITGKFGIADTWIGRSKIGE